MNYKEVEGIDENGNPTTFKIEIPSNENELELLKQLNEIKKDLSRLQNDYLNIYQNIYFRNIKKVLIDYIEIKEIAKRIKK